MIIGTPKSLEEVPILTSDNIRELSGHGLGMLQSGVPGEVPAAVPLRQMVQIIATLKKYHEFAESVAHVEAGAMDLPQLIERWTKTSEEARALIDVKAPEKPILASSSGARLILP